MEWTRIPGYITGTVDQELLLRNKYLAAENRVLGKLNGRPRFSDVERATLGPRRCRCVRFRCRHWTKGLGDVRQDRGARHKPEKVRSRRCANVFCRSAPTTHAR